MNPARMLITWCGLEGERSKDVLEFVGVEIVPELPESQPFV